MPCCDCSANQLLLEVDLDGIERLEPAAGGVEAAAFHELGNRLEAPWEGQLFTIDQMHKEGNIELLHLESLRLEHRPVGWLLSGQHKTAAELLELQAMGNGSAQCCRLKHLTLNCEIQSRGPSNQAPGLTAETIE